MNYRNELERAEKAIDEAMISFVMLEKENNKELVNKVLHKLSIVRNELDKIINKET